MSSKVVEIPSNFHVLATAIKGLSGVFQRHVTDLIQKVRVNEEVIAQQATGNIEIAMDYSDEDGKIFGLIFILDPADNFRMSMKLGTMPRGWNQYEVNKAMYIFADILTRWQPVHSVLFCPQLNLRELYSTDDLKESYLTKNGWVLNIRGMFNDGDEYDTGLRLVSEDELFEA